MDALELFGSDIALDEGLQPRIAANGELVLCDGVDTAVQDIRLRLFTYLGSLFYDQEFGSLVLDWIKDENTALNRAGLCSEVAMRIGMDQAVVVGSASCEVMAWDHAGVTLKAEFWLIEEQHPFNLVISVDRKSMEVVISDVNPGQ